MNFDATFKTANAPYNLYSVLTGVQTTGVTLKTGSKAIKVPRNMSLLRIIVDTLVAGTFFITSDATVSAANLVGSPIASGDARLFQGEGNMRSFPLPVYYFDIDTDDMLIHFEVQ